LASGASVLRPPASSRTWCFNLDHHVGGGNIL
jgi:hypothetical protein